jgi:hypothetical protein
MGRYAESKYVLVVENLSPMTRASDVRNEMDYWGPVRRCERDRGLKMALVEFDRCVPSVHHVLQVGRPAVVTQ